MLYFKLYPFTLLRQCRSFTFLFIYLGNCQCSKVISQVIIYLKLLIFLNTSSRSTRCWLASVSLFVALVCLGPRVILLVVDLSPSQSLPLWFAQHHELICSLLNCRSNVYIPQKENQKKRKPKQQRVRWRQVNNE